MMTFTCAMDGIEYASRIANSSRSALCMVRTSDVEERAVAAGVAAGPEILRQDQRVRDERQRDVDECERREEQRERALQQAERKVRCTLGPRIGRAPAVLVLGEQGGAAGERQREEKRRDGPHQSLKMRPALPPRTASRVAGGSASTRARQPFMSPMLCG